MNTSERTILDTLESFEKTLRDFNPVDGKHPSTIAFNITTVYKYSLLYLIYTKKIKMTDSEDKWISYESGFKIHDHYIVANSYLKRCGQSELSFNYEPFIKSM